MGKRRIYNTTMDSELIKGIRILAARSGKRQNDLIEEAIKDLLKKLKAGKLLSAYPMRKYKSTYTF